MLGKLNNQLGSLETGMRECRRRQRTARWINGYNAIIFNQRCESCNGLGTLTLDKNSYVERVAYRLKKWAGVRMEEQHYAGKVGSPHKSELCEGCKRGYCQERYD